MYYNVRDEIFEGILAAALEEYIDKTDAALPSDEEISAMYPISDKAKRKYKRIAMAKKYGVPRTVVYLKRAAIALLAAAVVSFGLLMTNKTVRAAVVEAIVEWCETHITIDFGKSNKSTGESSPESVEAFTIGYVTPGFELANADEYPGDRTYVYKKVINEEEYILISISLSEGTSISLDIEDVEYEEMIINGYDAYMIYDEGERYGSIVFGDSKYTVNIVGDVDKSELIKIAENIK